MIAQDQIKTILLFLQAAQCCSVLRQHLPGQQSHLSTGISKDGRPIFRDEKNHHSGRMPRYSDRFYLYPAQFEHITVRQWCIRFDPIRTELLRCKTLRWAAGTCEDLIIPPLPGVMPFFQRKIRLAEEDPPELGRTPRMIQMPMGHKDLIRGLGLPLYFCPQVPDPEARVQKGCTLAALHKIYTYAARKDQPADVLCHLLCLKIRHIVSPFKTQGRGRRRMLHLFACPLNGSDLVYKGQSFFSASKSYVIH